MKNLLCSALVCFAVSVSAQAQSPYPLHWSTTDANRYLETKENEIHLKPRTDGTGPGNVTATAQINLPDTTKWQASFDIRFGILSDQASSCHLLRGDHELGWVGADGFYKKMGVFVGKDNEVVSPTADTEWHHVLYISDGTTLSVQLDNKQVGSGPAQNVPDKVSFSNSQDMHVPCHQEGVWIRNFSVEGTQPVIKANPDTKNNQKDTLAAGNEATKNVDLMTANTREALRGGLVSVKVMNLTNAFDTSTIMDFAVTNNSKKTIMFWTTPVVVFADGSNGAIQSGMVSNEPFRSMAFQMNQALAMVNSPNAYSGPATPVQGKPVAQPLDTQIAPGKTLYFHCGTSGGNAASIPVQFQFKGGGWDTFTIDYKVLGVHNIP